MAFTQANLVEIEAAIIALAKGGRVVRVNLDGNSIEYGQVDLPKLESLKAKIQAEIQTASCVPRYLRPVTEKGL